MDWSKNLFELLKLTPRYTTPLVGITATLLFVPEEFLKLIGVFQLAQDYRKIIGIFFLASIVLLFSSILFILIDKIQEWRMLKSIQTKIKQRLHTLTEDEKQILRYYIGYKTRTNVLRYEDGIVQGLVSKHIIYRASSMGNVIDGFAFNITEFAWDYLHIYPHLLNGSTITARTDKVTNF